MQDTNYAQSSDDFPQFLLFLFFYFPKFLLFLFFYFPKFLFIFYFS